MFPSLRSERELDRGRDEVAVIDVVEPAGATELGPRHVESPRGAQVRLDTERQAVTTFDEVAAGSRRGAADIVLPGEARQDVPGAHETRVFETARDAVAP